MFRQTAAFATQGETFVQQYYLPRCSGILMPVFSLPGGRGIGSLGKPAYDFLAFLHRAGQSVWQILPVGPTGCASSPYQSPSAFAGNPYLIDPDLLAADGLLQPEDCGEPVWGSRPDHVDYAAVEAGRMTLLRRAFAAWRQRRPVPGCDTHRDEDFNAFLCRTRDWLPDYTLYMTARNLYGGKDWQQWPEPVRTRQPSALRELQAAHADDLEFWRFVQYEFDRQWQLLKDRAAKLNIRIMGDMPIYVSADSADAWAGRELFETDRDGYPTQVAGCPPDFFSQDGQHWGNPLYDWSYHKATGYAWWIRRMRSALHTFDLVRIDHFRGFDTYWSIPAGAKTAREGQWKQGPGLEIFTAMENAIGPLPVIAEDLGEGSDSVRRLLADSRFPGMKVLQFAFSGGENDFLPHNHIHNCVVYPGTHDNTTLRDWLENGSVDERHFVRRYLPPAQGESQVRAVLRGALASAAKLCVIPLQDWLELGADARVNTPGTVDDNWSWRAIPGMCTDTLADQIRELTETYLRV